MNNRLSNTLIGFLNLFSLLASIPIIGAGLWMARKSTSCQSFLQTPLLIIGFIILVISLSGFIGACFHVPCALYVYLVTMLILVVALLGITVFGFAVTGTGGGTPIPGRIYREYHLQQYSSWLREKVKEPKNWKSVSGCILGSKTCAKVAAWTPIDYLRSDMTPIQSGCCKPPTACTYGDGTMIMNQDPDCYKWNNDPSILCYDCDSCKAGVLETIRRDWHKLSVLLIVILILLICIYSIGCCAYQNARRAETDYPYGRNRMTKTRPRWDYHWWRWMRDRREDLW